MGVFELDGEELFKSEGGELRIGLFRPPVLAVSVSRAQTSGAELSLLAAMQSEGILTLDGEEWDVRLRRATTEGGYERVVGVMASENVLNWLDAPADEAMWASVLVYQRGPDENSGAFLKRVFEYPATKDNYLVGPNEDSVKFPAPGACIFRRSTVTNRSFLNAFTEIGAKVDAKLLGWRVIPYRPGVSKIAFAIADHELDQMSREDWEIAPGSFEQDGRWHLVVRARRMRPVKTLRHVLRDLFGCVDPGSRVFGNDFPIPSCPGWVRFGDGVWFASEISVKFAESHGGEESTIQHVDVVLEKRPPPAPVKDGGLDPTLLAVGTVTGWNDKGDLLKFITPRGEDWAVARTTPGFGFRELAARCMMPGSFGSNGAKGGLYLQPAEGDTRVVILTQGQVPVSSGAVVVQAKEVDEGDIVIQADKAKIELKRGSIEVLVDDKFNIIRL